MINVLCIPPTLFNWIEFRQELGRNMVRMLFSAQREERSDGTFIKLGSLNRMCWQQQ